MNVTMGKCLAARTLRSIRSIVVRAFVSYLLVRGCYGVSAFLLPCFFRYFLYLALTQRLQGR